LPHLPDEDKIDRIIPFIVELLSDEVAIVRAEACRTLTLVVESVKSITAQNATYIPEYLLPQMRHLATDPDVFVRATYAKGLVRLADAAVNMLEMNQAAKVNRSDVEASGVVEVRLPCSSPQSKANDQARLRFDAVGDSSRGRRTSYDSAGRLFACCETVNAIVHCGSLPVLRPTKVL